MQSVDTIAAIATPPGSGAIAVIRMSGPQATAVMQACTGKVTEPRRATLAYVRDAQGRVLDEVVATYFAGPASYTGEDVVELSCHGGMLVTRRVLERLLQCGARPAEPGEFTRRAFENGRMDLTRAEAVMDVINAGSDLALRAAQNQLHGAIFSKVESAVDKLISVAAHVEAYIDFPEEDIASSLKHNDYDIVLFPRLDDLISFALCSQSFSQLNTALYTFDQAYFLVIRVTKKALPLVNRLETKIADYNATYVPSDVFYPLLQEKGKKLISKNALSVLLETFK